MSDHDNEHELFEAWVTANTTWDLERFSHGFLGYKWPSVTAAWEGWQARAAAVRPVQDAVLPVPLSKAIYLLTERLRKSTLMLEKESRNGHPRHHKNTVAKNWSAIADSVDLMNAFLAAPIASTGNTERKD